MALCISILRKPHLFLRNFLVLFNKNYTNKFLCYDPGKSMVLDSDILDDFTTQLMRKKTNKWELLQAKHKLTRKDEQLNHKKAEDIRLNVAYLDGEELDLMLRDVIETNNFLEIKQIVDKFIECEKLPTLSILLQILSILSQNGDKHAILNITNLCKKLKPELLREYFNFKHYLAEATWLKGNVHEAATLFDDLYRNNTYLRRTIRIMLKFLIADTCTKHSEAALITVVSFAEHLANDFRDYQPLTYVWQACFLSEWFTDQTIALDLLNRNEGLLKSITGQLPYVVAVSLQNHRTEVVYRLLELLLKSEQDSSYKGILEALFHYRVQQGDLRACREIIQWSISQGIDVPAIQHETMIKLLITYASKSTAEIGVKQKPKPPSTSVLQFKF